METMINKSDFRTYEIIGSAMAVHSELGPGFLEKVYQEALEREFLQNGLPFERERKLPVHYKGAILDTCYRVDFVCYNTILVELKALTRLSGTEEAQILNYLKASGLRLALLFNFGTSALMYKRMVFDPKKHTGLIQI